MLSLFNWNKKNTEKVIHLKITVQKEHCLKLCHWAGLAGGAAPGGSLLAAVQEQCSLGQEIWPWGGKPQADRAHC